MDPLSITASSIAILHSIGSILHICYNTRAILKGKPWCLTKVQDEVTEFRGVLESIFQLTLDAQTSESDFKRNNALSLLAQTQSGRGPLILCLEDLQALEEILLKKYTSQPRTRMHAAIRAITWDLSENEIKPILDRLSRSKSALNLVLSADEAALLVELHKWSSTMTNDILHLKYSVKDLTTELLIQKNNQSTQQILQWLSPLDSWDSYASVIKRCHDGTGKWFLQSAYFNHWRDGSHPNIWLSGFTGSGKTVLLSNVIRELTLWAQEVTTAPIVAYFYFDFRNPEAQELRTLLGNIIRQILVQTGEIPDLVQDTFQTCMAAGSYRKPELPFLLETLKLLTYRSRVLVVIDALDEAEDRTELLLFFQDTCRNLNEVSFMVASRESDDIRQSLGDFWHVRIEDKIADVDDDITKYINYRLRIDSNLQWLNPQIKDEIARSLQSQSSGMFRWVHCQLENLGKLRTVKAIRESLTQLPQNLHETYDDILGRVCRADQESARRILLWVSSAVRPLSLDELHTAIAVDLDIDYFNEESLLRSPQDIHTLVAGLLSVTNQGHVTLAHMSIKSYLLSTEIQQSKNASCYAMSQEASSRILLRVCMRYISYCHFRNGPCQSSEEYIDRLRKFPFLKHAATFWPYYYKASAPNSVLEAAVLDFFLQGNRKTFMS
ncbi:hypothetical protein O1611_g5039 [Lasiodiplodia mahajangana]|uniref:Uncharacterized protein n=1 Tax=Lasiodiplodia mahajangana TaxID=1108764 RepID=A0ACC2JM89_9PEZI|nr:hypothetical protein O1611_g5039 [Lasiodiplodia mahajangana]